MQLVEDLKEEKNKAIDEAIQAATVDILAESEVYKYERDFYKDNFTALEIEFEKLKKKIIVGGIGLGVVVFFAGVGFNTIVSR